MEACAFMGEVLNSLPTPENAHCSLPVTDDFDNVNLVVAFMNARWQGMKDKLLNIPGYKENVIGVCKPILPKLFGSF